MLKRGTGLANGLPLTIEDKMLEGPGPGLNMSVELTPEAQRVARYAETIEEIMAKYQNTGEDTGNESC
jgi:hypothetical protein